jgi:hypothetical protein
VLSSDDLYGTSPASVGPSFAPSKEALSWIATSWAILQTFDFVFLRDRSGLSTGMFCAYRRIMMDGNV